MFRTLFHRRGFVATAVSFTLGRIGVSYGEDHESSEVDWLDAALAAFKENPCDHDIRARLFQFCQDDPSNCEKVYLAVLDQYAATKDAGLRSTVRLFGTLYYVNGGNMAPVKIQNEETLRFAISHDLGVRCKRRKQG